MPGMGALLRRTACPAGQRRAGPARPRTSRRRSEPEASWLSPNAGVWRRKTGGGPRAPFPRPIAAGSSAPARARPSSCRPASSCAWRPSSRSTGCCGNSLAPGRRRWTGCAPRTTPRPSPDSRPAPRRPAGGWRAPTLCAATWAPWHKATPQRPAPLDRRRRVLGLVRKHKGSPLMVPASHHCHWSNVRHARCESQTS
jgi:hypothetical protein